MPRRLSSVRRLTPPGSSSHAPAPSGNTRPSYVRAATVLKSAVFRGRFSVTVRSSLLLTPARLWTTRAMNTFHRLVRLSSVFALLLCPTLALGESPIPRIRGPIELTPSVPLEGSLNPHVRLSDDLGPLPPDTPIH